MHSGDLYKDSPGLSLLLKGSLTTEEHSRLVSLYSLACQYGALKEGDIVRIEGANFNPRPARIAQILLTDGAAKDLPTLATAVLSCSEPTLFEANPEIAKQFYDTYNSIRSTLSSLSSKPLVATERAIVLSHLLDELRHLHMRELSPSSLSQKITELRRIHQLAQPLPEFSRLTQIVDAAFTRASRLMENDD